jgi:tetratricopeptide (TPR) repeat protein
VLDNVRDEAQVGPLLPDPAASSRVLITSRHHLALDRASLTLALDVLPRAASVGLLSIAAGGHEAEKGRESDPTEVAALTELSELAGHLPLALSLTTGRIATRPDWTLADHAARLRAMHAAHRLEDGLEASLRLSYADLGEDDRRLLRLLSHLPVTGVEEHLAAAIGELPVPHARNLLDHLARASLLRPSGDGRHQLHDVVRLFLVGRSLDEDPPRVRQRSLERLYDYQIAATAAARARYAPQLRDQANLPGVAVPAFADRAAATAWLERERADLLAGAASALDHRRIESAVTLSVLLFSFLMLNTYVDDADRLYSRLAAATSGADRADALLALAAVNGAAGRVHQVRAPLEEALDLYEQLGHTEGVAKALHNLGALCATLGDYRAAADYYRRALDLATEAEGPAGVAMTVDNIGLLCARLGRDQEAMECYQLALELHRRLGDRLKEGRTLGSLGALATRGGHLARAGEHLSQALARSEEVGDWIGESLAVSRLAELDSLAGRHVQAVDGQRRAVELARRRPDASSEALEVLVGLVAAYRRSGLLAEAATTLSDAAAAAEAAGDPYWTARARAEGAELAGVRGDRADACRQWQHAAESFERLGCPEADLAARRALSRR